VSQPEKTTEEIIRELKQGRDWEANFQRLFERYFGQLVRFFRRKGFLLEDCQDLTQEVFFSVYKGLNELRQAEQFEVWLYRIALNAYRNELERRQAKKRAASFVALDEEPSYAEGWQHAAAWVASPAASPVDAVLEQERKEKLREALQELPQQMRRCVYLRLVQEVPAPEVAAIMNISVNTVKVHLHQARKILNGKLRHWFGEIEL
jgi:RNA polymerase sigma-70 factor (ECF subfamily)